MKVFYQNIWTIYSKCQYAKQKYIKIVTLQLFYIDIILKTVNISS